MNNKIISCLLYNNLNEMPNKVAIITKLFNTDKSAFYRWHNEYITCTENI